MLSGVDSGEVTDGGFSVAMVRRGVISWEGVSTTGLQESLGRPRLGGVLRFELNAGNSVGLRRPAPSADGRFGGGAFSESMPWILTVEAMFGLRVASDARGRTESRDELVSTSLSVHCQTHQRKIKKYFITRGGSLRTRHRVAACCALVAHFGRI